MSSIDPLSMSLDELAKVKKKDKPRRSVGTKVKGNTRGGKARRDRNKGDRNTPYGKKSNSKARGVAKPARKPQRLVQPTAGLVKKGQKGGSIRSRLGDKRERAKSGSHLPGLMTGVVVTVKPLNEDILKEDLEELFTHYGPVKDVKLSKYGNDGKKMAKVNFRKKSDAEEAVSKLDGRELDGTAMNVSIVGSAIKDDLSRKPKMFADRPGGARDRARRGDTSRRPRRGGRGGGRGRGEGRGKGERKEVSAKDLDAEMNKYMNAASDD
mmetsp:Transcript_4715/g.5943  ORF Transcript_4715/g.5943 Transcript_4715/m.5943 type:complete len:267 (-) Transcript_4715:118-918(-)|eukprot:CAMPEP_0204827162 /NCGR_PEP_ID=MMETSP1346-20131115/4703_1 /ASSEMBLY_ACC=CAM_ASM_000771 /TAXON_ID=215587 /ORGANISM="Aplanochytrium stocchinoi, Strain GSBS06" /LENGTH=266 /DNA_ID=CAMNT_0051955499 /DNA_START=71 /DNA_END=871 /DNA_ORIENTATION=-